ncbi:MAG: hydroxymethylglutaryl-CoA synthase [Bacillota bacterium]
MSAVGIISYGTYIPRLRITREEYKKAWGSCAADIVEKPVPDIDEDVLTMGIAAARHALRFPDDGRAVDILNWASTSYPYAEKLTAGETAAMLGLQDNLFSTEHGQSTRAGAEAFLTALAYLQAGMGKKALVIAADAPRAHPREPLEHGLGAAAVAFVLGGENVIAEVEGYTSFVAEQLGERYRPEGEDYLTDIGVRQFTSDAYNRLVARSVKELLGHLVARPEDYRYVVIHQTDGRAARGLALKLGFREEQNAPGMFFKQTGDTGVCSTLLGLAAVLDACLPGERVLVAAYGSGAGSIAFSLRVTRAIEELARSPGVKEQFAEKRYIDYIQYLKLKKVIL